MSPKYRNLLELPFSKSPHFITTLYSRHLLGSGGKPSTWFPPGKTRRAPRVNLKFPSIWEIFSFSNFFHKKACLMKVSNGSVQASFQILCPRMCDWFTFPMEFLEQTTKYRNFSFFNFFKISENYVTFIKCPMRVFGRSFRFKYPIDVCAFWCIR